MDKYESTFNTWNKLAMLYQEKFMDLDLYNDSYDKFCEHIPASASILELGCGPGNITRYLLAKDASYRITGTDVAPAMIELAKLNNPSATFAVLDCRQLNEIKQPFDAIMCGFCVPYLSKEDMQKLLKDAEEILEPGGIIYLSYIEGPYERSGFAAGSTGDEAYVYYYQQLFLASLLETSNFKTVECISIKYPDNETNTQTHTILIAEKVHALI